VGVGIAVLGKKRGNCLKVFQVSYYSTSLTSPLVVILPLHVVAPGAK
jgi:hypothetical protein